MLWGLLGAGLALAHGTPPQALGLQGRAGVPEQLAVSTTFGVLLSDDRGCSWRWVCEEGIGLPKGQRSQALRSAGGGLLVAAPSGLLRSTDEGCSFAPVPGFDATGATEIVEQGGTLLVTTGRSGAINGLWRSDDDGATFQPTGLTSDAGFFSAVLVAGPRWLVSSWYYEPLAASLWRTDDSGGHFERVDPQGLPQAGALTVLALQPGAPDVVLAGLSAVSGPTQAWLLRSDDGGRHFEVLLALTDPPTSAAFSADGALAWVAAAGRLYASVDGARTFAPSSVPAQQACISAVADARFVCGNPAADGFALAEVGDAGARPFLEWNSIVGPPNCPSGSTVAQTCGALWPVEQVDLQWRPDGGATACNGEPVRPARPCGCASAGEGALGLVGVSFFLRRGRSRRVPPTR